MKRRFPNRRPSGAAALVFALIAAAASPARAEDVSALLLQKTQAFSDAGQKGDGALMGRMVDDKVVFFNENGDRATKQDIASATPSPPNGVVTHMTVTDWNCEVHGDVAVASFIDDQKQDFHGQPFHARYRSVETWLKEGGDWRMIASQTIALRDDPATVTLSPAALREYAGAYEAAPGVRYVFALQGADLTASNGGAPSVQKAEMRDLFFTPGHSRVTKLFERDADGRITGFVLRRAGHDILYKRVA